MRRFIRLGDRTSHGGIVMTASKLFYIGDKAVARKGDICTCPIKGTVTASSWKATPTS